MTREELKQWRMKHGYTQTMLAQALRSHPMTISKWERGEREMPSFLFLALYGLECKEEVKKTRAQQRKKTKKESD